MNETQKAFSQFNLNLSRIRSYEGDLTITCPDICSRILFITFLNHYKEHPLRKSLLTEVYMPFQEDLSEIVAPGLTINNALPCLLSHRQRIDRWFQSWRVSAPWFMDDVESSIEFLIAFVLVHGGRLDGEDVPQLTCLPRAPLIPKDFNPVFQQPYPIILGDESAQRFQTLSQIANLVPDPLERKQSIRRLECLFVPTLESPEDFERRMRKQFDDALRTFTAEYATQYVDRKFVLRDADWSVRRIAGQTLRQIVDASPIHENADPEQTVKKAIERFAIDKLGLDRRMLTIAKKRKVQK